jgi:hypothetical protein
MPGINLFFSNSFGEDPELKDQNEKLQFKVQNYCREVFLNLELPFLIFNFAFLILYYYVWFSPTNPVMYRRKRL